MASKNLNLYIHSIKIDNVSKKNTKNIIRKLINSQNIGKFGLCSMLKVVF